MTHVVVVIPTLNRPGGLRRTLAAIAGQTFRDFETVVVDDGSVPAVQDALSLAELGEARARVLRQANNGGPARARNTGILATHSEYIAFCDDDVVPEPGWLDSLLSVARPGTAAVGPLLAPADWRPRPWNWWEAATLAREYERMERGLYRPTWRQFHTGNALAYRQDVTAAGLFDIQFTRAEDVELALRMSMAGVEFRFVPGARAWHYAERSLESWRRIPGQYGRFDRAIDRMHPELCWLRTVGDEQAGRAWPLRAARATARWGLSRRLAVSSAALIARGFFAAGRRRAASRALSVAWDIEYNAGLHADLTSDAA
jgi:GT2 family glycosyltransferase